MRHTREHGAKRNQFLGTQQMAQFQLTQNMVKGIGQRSDLAVIHRHIEPHQLAIGDRLHIFFHIFQRTNQLLTEKTDSPEPSFAERVRVMCRHLDLMVEVFGEELGCRMFRKIAPWYAKRFGPAHVFNKKVVQVSTRAQFHEILQTYTEWRKQFLDERGELLPRFQLAPMVASFMREPEPESATRTHIPVPKGPVEVW